MTPESFQRVRAIFDEVLPLPEAERHAAVSRLCQGDDAIRGEVESLLAASADERGALSAAAVELPAPLRSPIDTSEALIGRMLGQYRITGILGQGGMGVVYRAEQDRPRRTVALKLIRSPFVSPSLLRRFEREAQILGRLKHPGIAQIFEAGSVDDQRGHPQPFFAMELVEGPPLLAFVQEQGLSTRQRLELFAMICDGVEHAHQKGVVHRDLKPSNILVETVTDGSSAITSGGGSATRVGGLALPAQPKILDFGVARATDADVSLNTMQTGVGQILGTLQYMSPEQVRGDVENVDTRSDVYALGVMLYQLLTGKLPYDLRGKSLADAARVIGEEDPTRISVVEGTLRGDVETIVTKALEKDPARRYASAAALGADVRRFLADLPIVARPASTGYQLRKFARRNKALVGGVAATIVVLIVGVVGTSVGLLRANEARDLARARETTAISEARKANRSVQFLVGMLTAANPDAAGGREVTVREILDRAADNLDGELKDDPEVRLAAETAVARTYRAIGRNQSAAEHLKVAEDLTAKINGAESLEMAEILHERARLYGALSEWASVRDACLAALKILEPRLDPFDTRIGEVCETLSGAYASTGDMASGERFARRGLEIAQRARDPERIATSSGVLASIVERVGGPNWVVEAETLRRLEHQSLSQRWGPLHSSSLKSLSNLGSFLGNQGRDAEAIPMLDQVVDGYRRLYGPDDRRTLGELTTLATCLQNVGDFPRAEQCAGDAIKGLRVVAPESAELAAACGRLGSILHRQRKFAEAEPMLREAVSIRRKLKSANLVPSLSALSGALRQLGRYEEADSAMVEAIELRRATGALLVDFAILLNNRADGLAQWGKVAEAEKLFVESVEMDRKNRPGSRGLALNIRTYAAFLYKQNRFAEALPLAREAYELTNGQPAAQRAGILSLYALLLEATGAKEEAEAIKAQMPPATSASPPKP